MPTIGEALNLAEQALAEGDLPRAQSIFEQVLAVAPDEPGALNGLGVVAFRADRLDEAADYHRRAIARRDDNPAFHNNLNLVYCRQGRAAEAVACGRRALELAADSAPLNNNLGIALKQHRQLEAAAGRFRRAVELAPDYGDAHFNLANALVLLRRLDEAESEFRRALELAPGDADVHFNYGLLHLLRGDFARGWPEFEWRWGLRGFTRPSFAQPQWSGQPLAERTILLVGEQGLGDVIQMIRYAQLLKQAGATVLVECQSGLHALVKTAPGVDRLLHPGQAQAERFDLYVPLLSLPGVLGTTLETIPADVPYLRAEPARVERWRRELGDAAGLKVGIGWQGRPDYPLDAYRSIPLAEFAPLAACPGVRLFSLQKGAGREQLAALAGRLSIVDLGATLDEPEGGMADTPAAMMGLDLVIASDTAIAHLAGALGVPVWVALAYGSDWRWLLARQDSPWYPTMRLFRQTRWGDWAGVFQRMAAALRTLVSQRAGK